MKSINYKTAALLAAPLLFGCTTTDSSTPIPIGDCALGSPDAVASLKSGQKTQDGRIKLLNGRLIGPVEKSVKVGTYALGGALSPDGKYLVVSNNGKEDPTLAAGAPYPVGLKSVPEDAHSLSVIAVPDLTLRQTIPVPSAFVGVAFTPDGGRLYAAGGGGDKVYALVSNTDPAGVPYLMDPATDKGDGTSYWPLQGYPTGITVSANGTQVFVTRYHAHAVSVHDGATGKPLAGIGARANPYGIAVNRAGSRLYVSNMGDSSVTVVDTANANTNLATILVGKNPEGIALSLDERSLFVANSDSDTVAVIDTDLLQLADIIPVGGAEIGGASPVHIDVNKRDGRLLVTLAGDNAVAIVDPSTGQTESMISTGWYPSAAFWLPDGHNIAVINGKGLGGVPNPDDIHSVKLMFGAVSLHAIPQTDPEKAASIDTVTYNNNVARQYFSPACSRPDSPIPFEIGQASPIKHVVYIVRENKTYDSLLGDLYPEGSDIADGDPSLALFGEQITPNLHKLAREFANHDNFYNEVEQSLQGHIWIGAGWSNDFSEKAWLSMWGRIKEAQFFLPGMESIAVGSTGTRFDHLYRNGIRFRSYGELVGIGGNALQKYRESVNLRYPPFAMHIRDVEKAKIFFEDLQAGIFEPFTLLWVPNDHTYGVRAGKPLPESMIADNDLATGQIIEAISHSPFWKDTAIFIFEDDPQGTPDHVDAHRSVLLVVSPWAKRKHTSHVSTSFPSIHRTAELILGVPPHNRYTALAAPLYDAFTSTPDFSPYVAEPMRIEFEIAPENMQGAPGQLESESIDFEYPDQSSKLGLALWKHMRPGIPYPAAKAFVPVDDEEAEEEREHIEAIRAERSIIKQQP